MDNVNNSDQCNQKKPVRKLADGIYQLWLPMTASVLTGLDHVYSYLIEGVAGWWLIDIGWNTPDILTTLKEAFKMLQIDFKEINTILVSHCHPDHYGMAGKIKELSPKTQIVLHPRDADLIDPRYINFIETEKKTEDHLESHGVPVADLKLLGSASLHALDLVSVIKPDYTISDGEVIHTGIFDLEVIWTPGHSPGHICFYEPKNRFLFCGDHILPTITPNISSHILSGVNPLGGYINSLYRMSRLQVDEIHPGHEYSFTGLEERINKILEHHQMREDQIYTALKSHKQSAYDLAASLTWNVRGQKWAQFSPWFKRMATTEVVAHLEYMQSQSRIRRDNLDNKFFYSLR